MAQDYTIGIVGTLLAPNKSLLSIYNGTGSGKILKIYNISVANNQTAAVAGAIGQISLYRITQQSGGFILVAQKHDSDNEDLPAQIVAANGADIIRSDLFRKILWSNDEPTAAGASGDELECVPFFNEFWNTGRLSSDVEPIVCNPGEGLAVVSTGIVIVGVVDVFIEFIMINQ